MDIQRPSFLGFTTHVYSFICRFHQSANLYGTNCEAPKSRSNRSKGWFFYQPNGGSRDYKELQIREWGLGVGMWRRPYSPDYREGLSSRKPVCSPPDLYASGPGQRHLSSHDRPCRQHNNIVELDRYAGIAINGGAGLSILESP